MKFNLLTLLIVLFSISTFGQKREIYLNDDFLEITQLEFNKADNDYIYYDMRFESDSLITNVKVRRVRKGKISLTKLDSIRNELSILSNLNIQKENLIIINYYHGLDDCNNISDYSNVKQKYRKFQKKILKNEKVSSFFIFKSPEGIINYGKQLKWYKDQSGIIEKTFFPIPYPCGSYVLIDENGNFYVQKGEYNIEEIIYLIKDKKTTFSRNK